MIYQLPTGKSVELTVEQYLNMSDEDFEYLIATNAGEELGDPFTKSVIRKNSLALEDIEEIDPDDLTEDELKELEEMLSVEKTFDPDFIDYDNLEQ